VVGASVVIHDKVTTSTTDDDGGEGGAQRRRRKRAKYVDSHGGDPFATVALEAAVLKLKALTAATAAATAAFAAHLDIGDEKFGAHSEPHRPRYGPPCMAGVVKVLTRKDREW
jgi:hypothetical protein